MPYIRGMSEKLETIFWEHRAIIYHKPYNTLRELLVHPKDKTETGQKCGVVYQITCECGEHYVGETSRSMGTRFKEHTAKKGNTTAVVNIAPE